MMAATSKARSIVVDLPDEAFQHRPWNPGEVADEMRLLWLLEEVRSRRELGPRD